MTQIERVPVKPPAELLTCSLPAMPTREARENQDVLADVFERVVAALRQCYERLREVRLFVEETKD